MYALDLNASIVRNQVPEIKHGALIPMEEDAKVA